MTSIQLSLAGAQAQAQVTGLLTAGMSGVSVVISWDSAWEGLSKHLVCRVNGHIWRLENVERQAVLPAGALSWEPLGRNELFLGVEGYDQQGVLTIPSTMAYCGPIRPGTQGGPSAAPEQVVQTVLVENSPQALTWHQCPEAVRAYMEAVSYDPAEEAVSHIAAYAPATAVYANAKPLGLTVEGLTFHNQVPHVATEFVDGQNYGTVTPLDQVRWINTPYAPNVRDLGGWACDGGTVRYGRLFRGGHVSADDRAVLVEELGIRHDLDLRGATEDWIEASPLGQDIYFTRPTAYNWYTLKNTAVWKQILAAVFAAAAHAEPLYFHCTAGADRTGTVACLLEGLLGVSRGDIDKDYELTCFYSGTDTDDHARRRNESQWQGLMAEINALAGDSFRDKCVNFVAKLGFTAQQINAYRAAMIDGDPEAVTPALNTFAVTNSLDTGIYTDNDQATVTECQSYAANIGCAEGFVISGVTVLMDGQDITASVWSGSKTDRRWTVTQDLRQASSNNPATAVLDGRAYAAKITPSDGFKLETVKVLMGGVDVTASVWSGQAVETAQEETSQEEASRVTVSASLTNCTLDNSAATVPEGQSYAAVVTPAAGYKLETVRVLVDGTDVTDTAWFGQQTT